MINLPSNKQLLTFNYYGMMSKIICKLAKQAKKGVKYLVLEVFQKSTPSFQNGLPSFQHELPPFQNGLPFFQNGLPPFQNGLPSFQNGLPSFQNRLPLFYFKKKVIQNSTP